MQHGILFLPDSDAILAPTSALFFNDAPWLAEADARLVHPDISLDLAEAMLAQSLRDHHQERPSLQSIASETL